MTVCSMFGCTNRMHKGCGKHFFRFPLKDLDRLEKWIEAVQRDGWKPTLHSKVCSDHFTEKDYMIRPGAACPYLRVDAVPTPLVIVQRKRKTKKRKYTKNANTSGSSEAQPEKKKAKDQHGDAVEMQETPTPGTEQPVLMKACQTPAVVPEPAEKSTEVQENETGEKEGTEVEKKEAGGTQDKRLETQTQGGQQAPETQNQHAVETPDETRSTEMESDKQALETDNREQGEPRSDSMAAPSEEQAVETQAYDSLIDRMVGNTIHKETTQNEHQVALILAGLEDAHCEMQAAEEARAAREAASSDNESSSDNVTEYIPFDHAYTTLTASDKENDTPVAMPAAGSVQTSAFTPIPVAIPKPVKLRKKIKTLQKQVLRQGVKIKSLKETLVELRKGNLVEKEPERVISEHCSGLALALFTNQLKNRHRKCSGLQYSNLLKDFALDLYCASPKAYKFCRLFLSLPHPVSLRHWKSASEASQGAITQAGEPQGDVLQATISHSGVLQGLALQNETVQEQAAPTEATQEEQGQ